MPYNVWVEMLAAHAEGSGVADRTREPPLPSSSFVATVVSLEFSRTPSGDPLMQVTESRIKALDQIMRTILSEETLGCGQAASLADKLGLALAATYGRAGRAKLKPLLKEKKTGVMLAPLATVTS